MSERIRSIFNSIQQTRQASLEAAEYHRGEYKQFLRAEALEFFDTLKQGNQYVKPDDPKYFWDTVELRFPILGLKGNQTFEQLNSLDEANLTVEGLKYGVPYEQDELAFARVTSKNTQDIQDAQVAVDFKVELFGTHDWDNAHDNFEVIPVRVQVGDMEIFYIPEGFSKNVSTRSGFLDNLREIEMLGWREKAGLLLPFDFDPYTDSEKDIMSMGLVTTPRFSIENRFWFSQQSNLYPLADLFQYENKHGHQYFPFIRNSNQKPRDINAVPEGTLF